MDIKLIYDIVSTVSAGGLQRVVLEVKKDSNEVFVSGIDEQQSVVVFSGIPNNTNVLDKTLCIGNVKTFLDRLSLFDLTNVNIKQIENPENADLMKCLVVAEGKKKVQYTFVAPADINYPTGRIEDEIVHTVVLTKGKVEALNKAIQATVPKAMTLRGLGNDIFVDFFDGNKDTFTDVIGTNDGSEWSRTWFQSSVLRLVKQALKTTEEIELRIGKRGPVYIDVNGIEFMVMPYVE